MSPSGTWTRPLAVRPLAPSRSQWPRPHRTRTGSSTRQTPAHYPALTRSAHLELDHGALARRRLAGRGRRRPQGDLGPDLVRVGDVPEVLVEVQRPEGLLVPPRHRVLGARFDVLVE